MSIENAESPNTSEDAQLAKQVPISFSAPAEPSALQLKKRRASDAVRHIIDSLIAKQPDEAQMTLVATQLEKIAEQLATTPNKVGRSSFGYRMSPADVRDFVECSPLTGHANPIAPPMKMWIEDQAVRGFVRFAAAFEGAPGVVHGGYVAAVFDELLGFTQGLSKRPGMTGTLTITYCAPTPLLTDLRMEGSYEGTEGRKIYTSGKLFAGEVLLAEAKAVFITLTEAQQAAVLQMQSR